MNPRPDPAQGIFETVRVADGRVHLLAAHLDRLFHSWREVYRSDPPVVSAEDILAAAEAPAAAAAATTTPAAAPAAVRVRIDITPAPALGPPTVTFIARPVARSATNAVALAPATVPGGLGAHKWQDRSLLDGLGANPVPLLIDTDGTVLEAAWGNVWVLDGDTIRTPRTDGRILPGVTRGELLRRAAALGLHVEEGRLSLADIGRSDATFLTSSVRLAVSAAIGAAPAEHPRVTEIRATLADT